MSEDKRFTNVTLDFENDWIKLYDNGLFFIVPIHFTDKEEYGLPTLEDLLNELNNENKELKQENRKLREDLEHCANQFTNDGKNVLLSLR